jgi:hypothetical protein
MKVETWHVLEAEARTTGGWHTMCGIPTCSERWTRMYAHTACSANALTIKLAIFPEDTACDACALLSALSDHT